MAIKDGEGIFFHLLFYFLDAFMAALVVFPDLSTFSTDLITPTATVCLISLTAKRPKGG